MARRRDEIPAESVAEPLPSDNVKPASYKETFDKRKVSSEFLDPCARAHKASFDCLNRNDYDRDKCLDFFQAYRDCKKTWMEQRKSDRRAGRA